MDTVRVVRMSARKSVIGGEAFLSPRAHPAMTASKTAVVNDADVAMMRASGSDVNYPYL
jgi:hypothetical protein